MKHTARSVVRTALHNRGYRMVRDDGQRQLIRELVDWHGEAMPPRLPRRERRVELLADVADTSLEVAAGGAQGVSVSAALYLIRSLHQALATCGDVCQFGVGGGHVAALLAHEIHGSDRTLWLYDTGDGRRGGQPPGRNAEVLDVTELEGRGRGRGGPGSWVRGVLERLEAIGYPPAATRIVPGRIDGDMTAARLPRRIAFAYVDLARNEPTLAALTVLHDALSQGARVVVDGYGALSPAARTAADQFLAMHGDDYDLSFPLRFAGNFAILRKLV